MSIGHHQPSPLTLYRLYRLGCRFALWLGLTRLGYALSDRADELVRESIREGRPIVRRRRRRRPGSHADNGVRWMAGQLGVALALLYLAAAALKLATRDRSQLLSELRSREQHLSLSADQGLVRRHTSPCRSTSDNTEKGG